MKERFALASGSSLTPPIELRNFWEVAADKSYNVYKSSDNNQDTQIAILTDSGQGLVELSSGKKFDLRAGSLFLFHDNEICHYCCAGDEWNFYWFAFKTYELAGMTFNQGKNVKRSADEPAAAEEILKLLHRDNLFYRRAASAIFAGMLNRWLADSENLSRAKYANEIESIIDLLYQHQDGRWTVEKMAARINMSPRNFRRSFIAITGMPPKKYYDNIRLETACNLLPLKIYSIEQISEMLGFSSQFHLSRMFKRKYGMPPGRFKAGRI
jgi:AraC-like DNA-binding protein